MLGKKGSYIVTELSFSDQEGRIKVLLLFAIILHVVDAISGFNRGPQFWFFFTLYMFYALLFYFLTVEEFNGKIYLYNAIFAFGVSLAAVYIPFLIIFLSKYFPSLSVILIFAPVWPMVITYFVGSGDDVIQKIGNWYLFAWATIFLVYFLSNMPTNEKNVFYENSMNMDVMTRLIDTWNFIYSSFSKFFLKISNSIMNGISDYYNSIMNSALGVDTTTEAVTNTTPKNLKGLFIEDVKPLSTPFYKDVPVIFYFTVSTKNLDSGEVVGIYCFAINSTNYGVAGDVSSLSDSTIKNQYTFNGNEARDFQCQFKDLKKGNYKFKVVVQYDSKFDSYMPVYIISRSEFVNLRKLNEDFYSFYHFDQPKSHTSFAPVFVALGFSNQPLIESTYSVFSFKMQKAWSDDDGLVAKVNSLNISMPSMLKLIIPSIYQKGNSNGYSSNDKSKNSGKPDAEIKGSAKSNLLYVMSDYKNNKNVFDFQFNNSKTFPDPIIATFPVSVGSIGGQSVLKDFIQANADVIYEISSSQDFTVTSY